MNYIDIDHQNQLALASISEQDDDDEAEESQEHFGCSELPAASVVAMAESVGVDIDEDIAGALGELAMRKLRAATLLALQFCDHENSSGLRVSDFSKAEVIMNCESFGHNSPLPAPAIKPIGLAVISVLDEGPEIDLLATMSASKVTKVRIEDLDPKFHVHHAVLNCKLSSTESNFGKNSTDEEQTDFDVTVLPVLNTQTQRHTETLESPGADVDEPASPTSSDDETSVANNHNAVVLYNYNHTNSDNDLDGMGSENHIDGLDETQTDFEIDMPLVNIHDNICHQYMELDGEWVDYMKIFVSSFFDDNEEMYNSLSPTKVKDKTEDNDFDRILKDLVKHGALPVLDLICDFFSDYAKGIFVPVSKIGLRRAVSVIDAFLLAPCGPSTPQMQAMSAVLIEIIILPPPYEIQQYLMQVFMKILKNYDELLTWTCTYITEVMKRTSEVAIGNLSDVYKTILHGALCLTNGLELLNIQVAQEFGWHTAITTFSRKHRDAIKAGVIRFKEIDGYLEEELLSFSKNFLLNYKKLLSPKDMNQIHHAIREVYGEKIVPYLCNEMCFSGMKFNTHRQKFVSNRKSVFSTPTKSSKSNYNSGLEANSIIRKGYYKNRKMSIRYKYLNLKSHIL